jgi:Domain of unknown function (DUF4401)
VTAPANIDELADLMRMRGVIATDASPPPSDAVDRPWFISLLQGIAGWLAGILLLVFVGLMLKPDSMAGIFALGLVLLGAAWALYFADRNAVFLDQLALAISIAGQIAVVWSVVKDGDAGLPMFSTMLAVQLFVLAVMPNNTARILAAFFACTAWAYTAASLLRPGKFWETSVEGVADHAAQLPPLALASLTWALTWLPLMAITVWLMKRESNWMASGFRRFARPALTGLLVSLSFGSIAVQPFAAFVFGISAIGMPVGWWILFPMLAMAMSSFAIYCAFILRNTGLLGVGILGALLHLARFYYMFGNSLLAKSGIMLVVGALALLGGVWAQRRLGSGEATS